MPDLKCPFTGKPIEIVPMGGAVGHELGYMARVGIPGVGGWWTSVFPNKEELVHLLSMRDGVPAPGVPAGPVPIEVRELTAPAPDAFADQRGREEELDHAVEDFAERIRPRRARRSARAG